jgi:hypothetical protein
MAGGITGAVQIMSAVGRFEITPDSAAGMFRHLYKLDEEEVNDIVGDATIQPPPARSPPTEESKTHSVRDAIKALHLKQTQAVEEGMGHQMARHFPALRERDCLCD